MSVEILREAAGLMRERAQAAIDYEGIGTHWVAKPHHRDPDNLGWNVHLRPENDGCDDLVAELTYDYEGHAATHIASWHPAVALAVADWLEVVADYGQPEPGSGKRNWEAALATARTYLGRPS